MEQHPAFLSKFVLTWCRLYHWWPSSERAPVIQVEAVDWTLLLQTNPYRGYESIGKLEYLSLLILYPYISCLPALDDCAC